MLTISDGIFNNVISLLDQLSGKLNDNDIKSSELKRKTNLMIKKLQKYKTKKNGKN